MSSVQCSTKHAMSKRKTPDDDGDELIQLRPIDGGEHHNTALSKVGKYLFGKYIGDKLLSVCSPPPDSWGALKHLAKLKGCAGVKNVPDGVHDVFDIINHLVEYNKALYLTQRINFVLRMSIPEVRAFITTSITESELVHRLCLGTNRLSIFPMYNEGLVTEIEHGAYVVHSVATYFTNNDRASIDMASKQKCYDLLDFCVARGWATGLQHFTDHPPIPLAMRRGSQSRPVSSFYQEPIPTFDMIDFLDASEDNDLEPMDASPSPVTVLHLKALNSLRGKECCFVYIGHKGPPSPPIAKAMTTDIDDMKGCKRTTFVLVFRNHGLRKMYDTVPHSLDPRVTRTHSLVLYIKELNEKATTFMSYVTPYR